MWQYLNRSRVLLAPSLARSYYADSIKIAEQPSRFVNNELQIRQSESASEASSDSTENWRSVIKIESGKLCQDMTLYNPWIYSTHKEEPDKKIGPKTLYSVPQLYWDQMIDSLEKQSIVELLNLRKHRHLWWGYNYALSAEYSDIRIKRAGLIGSYHFLLSIALMSPSPELTTSEQEKYYRLQQDLHNGHFDIKKMESLDPAMTHAFLKKGAHACFTDLSMLSSLARGYSECRAPHTGTTFVSDKRLSDAINRMPSSVTQPEAFSSMVEFARLTVFFYLDSNFTGGRILFNGKNNVSDVKSTYLMSGRIKGQIDDYINALFNDLIVRHLIKSHKTKSKSLFSFFQRPSVIDESVLSHYLAYLQDTIMEGQSIKKINELQQRFHRNLPQLNSIKPNLGLMVWEPIINSDCINGFTFSAITSNKELQNHGDEMEHCAGGYAPKCLANRCNIIRLVDDEGIKSTIELSYEKGKKPKILQHFGKRNTEPLSSHLHFGKALLKIMSEGQVIVNQRRLEQPPIRSENSRYPYDLEDLGLQETIFNEYKKLKLLPPILDAEDYTGMLKKLGLDTNVDDKLSQYSTFSQK